MSGGAELCGAATPIAGDGTFFGDNVGAGTDGPSNCGGLGADVWYDWTAPGNGTVTISMCNPGTGYDTVLTAYDTAACQGAMLACNDDTCPGFLSQISFGVTNGNVYKIQVGGFSGATGAYEMSITTAIVVDECEVYDIGVTSNSLGFGAPNGTDVLWMHREGTVAGSTQVVSISTAWGSPLFGGGNAPPDGTAARVGIWDDPNDDGNPNDLVLLQEINTTVNNGDTDTFQTELIALQLTSGIYFIGASTSGAFPAPMDETSSSLGRAWVCGDNAGTINYNNLNAEPLPPADMDSIGFNSVFLLRAACQVPCFDDCSGAAAISGPGPFAFDNCCATTGAEGQTEGICLFFGQTGITNDEWYTWGPAPTTAPTQVSLCAGTVGVDTKMAVYDGSGCPGAAAIACNDDSCGLVTQLVFNATAGNFYTFQLGNFPGATCGSGSFEVTQLAPPGDCDAYDDGQTENSLGFGAASGTDVLWMHVQGATGGSTVVKSISTAWGTPLFGGTSAPPAGTPVRVGIWDDPNDDGNPNDLVLLQEVAALSTNPNTDIKQTVLLSPSVQTSGVYFIGASSSGSFPAPMDENSSSSGRAWVCGDNAGTITYANLNGEPLPPAEMDSLGFPAVFLLECDCKDINITPMCFGDGSEGPCPCANNGTAGNGCGWDVGPPASDGGNLAGSGNPIDSADTLVLTATNTRPSSLCLLVGGDAEISPAIYGDGLRCFAGNALRLFKFSPNPGSVTAPSASAIPPNTTISDRSAQLGGPIVNGERVYQLWYRVNTAFGCADRFNVTNGVRVLWSL